MIFTKFIRSMAVVSVFLILAAVFLISCGEKAGGEISSTTDAGIIEKPTEGEGETGGEEEFRLTTPNLPDMDWNAKEINFLVRGPEFNEWQSQDIYVEEENGEPVNDAVYKRNAILEDRYNYLIKEVPGTGAIQSMAEKSVLSGDNAYQVLMCNTQETNNLAMKGYLSDLRKVDYLDLNREYWDQNSIYGFTVEGKTLFMTGDLSIMANDATWIFMFNKKLLQELQIENPYTLVKEGKWTADKLYDIMKGVSKDLNGDGTMKGANDLFGLATHDSTFDGLFFSMGMRVSVIGAGGVPELSMNNEKISQVMEKTAAIMDKEVTFNGDWQLIANCFEEDRALFYGEVLQCVIRRRSMDTDFGVLPLPKLDEAQTDYAHMVHVTACMVGIPNTLGDDETAFAGFAVESIAAESKNWLVPAYYTTALEGKFMRDEESKEMLDIILRTRRYDLGYAAGWGGMFSGYVSSVKKGSNDFASIWDKYSAKAETAMEKDIEKYRDIP